MYNRETRRSTPRNFIYADGEMEVDSSVVLKQSFCRQSSRMKYRQGKAVFEYENIARPLAQTPNGKISEVAFADNFAYYFTDEAPAFSRSDRSKATLNFSAGNIDLNSEDGCNIDTIDSVADIAAIPQPSRNYIFSRRCREFALRIFLPLLMLFALPIMNSCKEPDNPLQPTPEPEPTPVVPTKEIVLDMVWRDIIAGNVSKDTIKKYTDMEDVKFVFLNFTYNDDVTPGTTSTYPTIAFHTARDTLQTRFDISPKVRGSGIIYVNASGGAHVQSTTSGTGMAEVDSIWYADKGYQIERYYASQQNSK